MSKKTMLYSKRGILQGTFSNKKNLWEDLERTHDGDMSELMMKLSPTRPVDLTYPKLAKHLGDRKQLNIYLREDIEIDVEIGIVEDTKPIYQVWETEVNKHYEPEWVKED